MDSNESNQKGQHWKRNFEAFFLGPKGENTNFFMDLVKRGIDNQRTFRENYDDKSEQYITQKVKNQKQFIEAQHHLQNQYNKLLENFNEICTPFFFDNFFSHMHWDCTIPSFLGNFVGMIYNQNNCAYETSPLTTHLEIESINKILKMVGYKPMILSQEAQKGGNQKYAWGHFTSGGTIANIEALWAARNNKFLAFTVRKYLEKTDQLSEQIKKIKVMLPTEEQKELLKLSRWQILNIESDEAIELYQRVFKLIYQINDDDPKINEYYAKFQKQISQYSLGSLGILKMSKLIEGIQDGQKFEMQIPKIVAPTSFHYSVKKAVSLIGVGDEAIQLIPTDENIRINLDLLRQKFQDCLEKKIPILALVVLLGGTSESAVDPFVEIIELRKEFMKKGLYFHFHIDAAYGGYYCSLIRQLSEKHWISLPKHTIKQMNVVHHADSITIDPHKMGCVPFRVGSILYRYHKLKNQINFSAPYIFDGKSPNTTIYSIEGTKQGFSSAGVYLSHTVLPLNRENHGEMLERGLINAKIFQASLYQFEKMTHRYEYTDQKGQKQIFEKSFKCLPLALKFSQKYPKQDPKGEKEAYQLIAKTIPSEMEKKIRGTEFEKFYLELGSDINIALYGLNFEGNTSLKEYNKFIKSVTDITKASTNDRTCHRLLFIGESEIKKGASKAYDLFLKRYNFEEDDDKIVIFRSALVDPFFMIDDSQSNNPNQKFLKRFSTIACQAYLNYVQK